VWFHRSNLGSFDDKLPVDSEGYVKCDPRKVDTIIKSFHLGIVPPEWACTGNNLVVAQSIWNLAANG